MTFSHPKRSIFESIIFVVVCAAILFFIANRYFVEQRYHRQRVMYYQLLSLRQGIGMFKAIEKRNPKNLVELASSTYTLPGDDKKRPYIQRRIVDPEGRVTDPFGNPYAYDRKRGWVGSSTPGYSFW